MLAAIWLNRGTRINQTLFFANSKPATIKALTAISVQRLASHNIMIKATLCLVGALSFILLSRGSGFAQNITPFGTQSAPIIGQTGGITPLTSLPKFGNGLTGLPQLHYSPTKTACVKVDGFSRSQVVNPKIYDNVLLITNSCGQTIGLQACYYEKKGCLDLQIEGYARKEIILGIQFNGEQFRYEYREKFN